MCVCVCVCVWLCQYVSVCLCMCVCVCVTLHSLHFSVWYCLMVKNACIHVVKHAFEILIFMGAKFFPRYRHDKAYLFYNLLFWQNFQRLIFFGVESSKDLQSFCRKAVQINNEHSHSLFSNTPKNYISRSRVKEKHISFYEFNNGSSNIFIQKITS